MPASSVVREPRNFYPELQNTCIAASIISTPMMLVVQYFLRENWNIAFILTKENGPLENVGLVSCFGASILFFYASFKTKWRVRRLRRAWLSVLSVAFFLLAMEEISWGQHVFGWSTPSAFEANMQAETNVHNLDGIHQRAHDVGIAMLALYFFVFPIAYTGLGIARSLFDHIQIPVVPLPVALLFGVSFIFYAQIYNLMSHEYLVAGGQAINFSESVEYVYQFCAFLFAAHAAMLAQQDSF